MNEFEIADKRDQKDFKGITFSKYKKGDAKKQLLNSLLNNRIEPACYWSIEFICAGHYIELWDIILAFYSKYIHLGNPKLPLYLSLRFSNFQDIVLSGYVDNELQMRNNNKIRLLFAEIICVLALSIKKYELTTIKVCKEDFNISNISDKLKADNVIYAQKFFKKEDPKELFVALNEFIYNLTVSKNSRACFYWLEWLFDYGSIYKKKNKSDLLCGSRNISGLDNKNRKDFIWILWEVILNESERLSGQINKICKSLIEVFTIKYNSACKKKRRFLIYSAILLITEISNFQIPIISDEKKVEAVKKNIDVIYKQVKKNEIKPDTDYLFNNSITKNTNLESTIKKLDKMNSMSNLIIRRN